MHIKIILYLASWFHTIQRIVLYLSVGNNENYFPSYNDPFPPVIAILDWIFWQRYFFQAHYKMCRITMILTTSQASHFCRTNHLLIFVSKKHICWYTEKTTFPFPFTLNEIWSWWQFSFQFWTIWNSIWFKIEKKTVTTIISHSIWKEMEI